MNRRDLLKKLAALVPVGFFAHALRAEKPSVEFAIGDKVLDERGREATIAKIWLASIYLGLGHMDTGPWERKYPGFANGQVAFLEYPQQITNLTNPEKLEYRNWLKENGYEISLAYLDLKTRVLVRPLAALTKVA